MKRILSTFAVLFMLASFISACAAAPGTSGTTASTSTSQSTTPSSGNNGGPAGGPVGGGAGTSEHMYSFDYVYKIESVRDWLFAQVKSANK